MSGGRVPCLTLSYVLVHLHDGALNDCCRHRIALDHCRYVTSDVGEWRHFGAQTRYGRNEGPSSTSGFTTLMGLPAA